jgi:RNA polymerase sigma-70 factor (ECF subfamily)
MQVANTLEQAFSGTRAAVLLSGIDGIALYANDAVERKTGFSLGEVIGRTPGKLWGGNMPRAFYDELWETIEEKQEPFVAALTNTKKNKERYDEFLAIAPVFDEKHETLEYYLALQMSFLAPGEERERFERSFKDFFSRQSRLSAKGQLRFVADSIGASLGVSAPATQSLSEIFRDLLIAPFESRFAARREDRGLIMAAQKDAEQFSVLYEKYRNIVFSYFMRHVGGNADTAEDLMQDTFCRGFFYLDGFRLMNASYGTYLLRIAHNVLINHFRKKQPLNLLGDIPEDQPIEPAVSDGTLWHSSHLSVSDQRMLAMKYREGYSFREIAGVFGVSENAAKLRLSRARKKLRSALQD